MLKRIATTARFAAIGLAGVLLLAAAILLLIEKSGWLKGFVQRDLATRLGSLGDEVQVEAVRLRWFEPVIEFDGVHLGDDGELVRLDHVLMRCDANIWNGLRPSRITIDGGHVRLEEGLLEIIERFRREASGAERESTQTELPEIHVRDIELELRHPEWGRIPVGNLEAVSAADADGRRRVEGHLVPSLAGPDTEQRALYLSGREDEPGTWLLELASDGVELGVEGLPGGTVLERLRDWKPRGRLQLDARARIALGPTPRYSAQFRGRLSDGSCVHPDTGTPVRGLTLDWEADCTPERDRTWSHADSWDSKARFRGQWSATPLSGWIFFGREEPEGTVASATFHVPYLELNQGILQTLGAGDAAAPSWAALRPTGSANCMVGVRLDAQMRTHWAFDALLDESGGATFYGWKRPDGRSTGFPIPADRVSGHVLLVVGPELPYRTRLDLIGLTGFSAGTSETAANAWGSGWIEWPLREERIPDFDLRFGGRNVAVDPHIEGALAGLVGAEWIWPTMQPSGGAGDALVRLLKNERTVGLITNVDVELRDLSMAWTALPAKVSDGAGHLSIVIEPGQQFGAGFAFDGRTATSESVRLRGRVQSDPDLVDRTGGWERHIQSYEAEVNGVALRGSDRTVVAQTWPGVGLALEQFAPVGKADVAFLGARARAGAPFSYGVEVCPQTVNLTPRTFNMNTRDVRGRVLVDGVSEAPETPGEPGRQIVRTRVAPLIGSWPGDTRVALNADFRAGGQELTFSGAGIDIQNRALVGALRQAFAEQFDRRDLDLSLLDVDGRIDLAGTIRTGDLNGVQGSSRYQLYLRDNDLSQSGGSGFSLRGLRGALVQEGDSMVGDEIEALLGDTPVELHKTRLTREGGGLELETLVNATGLPLDRQHLGYFLDADTVDTLVDEFELSGFIDFSDAVLTFVRSDGSDDRVTLAGRLTPHDVAVRVGLPLGIERAAVLVRELVFQSGRVRVWADVRELHGTIAERAVQDAELTMTLLESQLSVLDLAANLEGGSLTDLSGRGGPAFSIELQEPHAFDLGLALDDVQVAGLLRGVFESDFADTGTLEGRLRVAGLLGRLTSITGSGNVSLVDSRLWSIPVVRSLFTQLGLDDTAVFESMHSRFRIEDGSIAMEDIRVSSPLLRLVGSGTLGFDGALRHDLEVRYDLVDNLGPLTRLLYWVQNNLIRVSVRGDMARPVVFLKGLLSFLRAEPDLSRDLPLPSFSPLPERF